MTIIYPKFKNARVQGLAEDCGLTFIFENIQVSNIEVEYFVDCLIQRMINIVHKNTDDHYAGTDLEDEMLSYKSDAE